MLLGPTFHGSVVDILVSRPCCVVGVVLLGPELVMFFTSRPLGVLAGP